MNINSPAESAECQGELTPKWKSPKWRKFTLSCAWIILFFSLLRLTSRLYHRTPRARLPPLRLYSQNAAFSSRKDLPAESGCPWVDADDCRVISTGRRVPYIVQWIEEVDWHASISIVTPLNVRKAHGSWSFWGNDLAPHPMQWFFEHHVHRFFAKMGVPAGHQAWKKWKIHYINRALLIQSSNWGIVQQAASSISGSHSS